MTQKRIDGQEKRDKLFRQIFCFHLPVLNGGFLNSNSFVPEQREEFLQVYIIELWSLIQFVSKPGLCSQNLWTILRQAQQDQEKRFTILFENLGSSEYLERLREENALMTSKNDDSGAFNARSTRL